MLSALRRLAVLLLLGSVILGAAQTSASAEDQQPGRVPGLPFVVCHPLPSIGCAPENIVDQWGWLNSAQVGMAGSVRSKQWARVPLTMLASAVSFGQIEHYDETDRWNFRKEFLYDVQAFLVSPKGSADNYGDSALIPVRTVAFGSIPTVVTLQVSQQRDSNGLPFPLRYEPYDSYVEFPVGQPEIDKISTVERRELKAPVNVKVRSISVDGVDLGLQGSCETGPKASLVLANDPLRVITPHGYPIPEGKLYGEFDPTVDQYGTYGGTLRGSLDIPSFSGCVTTEGDDISPILTSAVSGPDNPLTIRLGQLACANYTQDGAQPTAPGVNSPTDPEAHCDLGVNPKNPKIVTVPKQIDYPTQAPRPTPVG